MCPSGTGPGIILCIKKPVPCLTSRGPRARSRDPRAGPQICPSPKQLIFLHTACEVAVKPPKKPCAPAVSQFKTAYKCCFQASQPTVHSSGAISVKRRGSSQKPCAPGVSLWADFTPPGVTSFLCLVLLCAAGVGPTLHRVGRDKPGACRQQYIVPYVASHSLLT